MGEFCGLLFELSSEERVNILRVLGGGRSKLTCIAKSLGMTNQECSRHVARLIQAGLLAKEPDGGIGLTPYANQVIGQLRSLEFSTRHRQYFLEHTVDGIPARFQARLGELNNCRLVDDVMVVFKNIENMYVEAGEYALRVTDRFMLTMIPRVEEAFDRGVVQRLLDPEDIVVPRDYRNTPRYERAMREGQFINRSIKRCDFFLAMSEKGVASLSFPRLDGRFDYTGFASSDAEFHAWCRELFEHYYALSKAKSWDWLARKLEAQERGGRV